MRHTRFFPRLVAAASYGLMALIVYAINSENMFWELGKTILGFAICLDVAIQIYIACDRYNNRKEIVLPKVSWLFFLGAVTLKIVGFVIASNFNAEDDEPFIFFCYGVSIVLIIVESLFFYFNTNYMSEEAPTPVIDLDTCDNEEALKFLTESKDKKIQLSGFVHHTENIESNGFAQIVYVYNKKEDSEINVHCYLSSKMDVQKDEPFAVKGTLTIENDFYGNPVYKII